MARTYIGIDNGVTGTIAFINSERSPEMFKTPVKNELKYTKAKAYINRLDFDKFSEMLRENIPDLTNCFAVIERPMINGTRFNASMSAIRCLEATLIALEEFKIPHQYIDSKQWQRVMLPSGIVGSDKLKKASLDIGLRLFPRLGELFKKHKDADGILMAEWAKREQL